MTIEIVTISARILLSIFFIFVLILLEENEAVALKLDSAVEMRCSAKHHNSIGGILLCISLIFNRGIQVKKYIF